jgi:hypothetical protein
LKTQIKKIITVIILCITSSVGFSQVVIQADVAKDLGGGRMEYSVVTLKSGALAPTTAIVDFFWFSSGDVSTITQWGKASDWISSSLYSNKLGSLQMGDGYASVGPAQGLFSGNVTTGVLSGAVGNFFAAAVTSGTELGVFRATQTVPPNAVSPAPPAEVAFSLADVNSGGVMVGSFSILPTVTVLGDVPLTNIEGYGLVPEPSSASLLAIGVAGLVALRVRRKS